MAELWNKKKKILSRKERFKITDDFNKGKKDKEENFEKLTQKEDEILKQQSEEKIKYDNARRRHDYRCETVARNCDKFRAYRMATETMENEARDADTRRRYPEIVNLRRIVPWVNERISRWNSREPVTNRVKNEINECIEILNMLTEYTENPLNLRHLRYWYECKRNVRDELYRKLDFASYAIVKDIEKKMAYLDSEIMFFKECDEHVNNFMWTVLDKPRTGKDDKFPLNCNFGDLGIGVGLPKCFYNKPIVVRCLWTMRDYFSEDCRTWKQKAPPDEYRSDFLQYHRRMWEKLEITHGKLEEDMNAQLEKEKTRNLFNKIKYLVPSSSKDNLHGDTKAVNEPSDKPKEILTKLIQSKKLPVQKVIDEDQLEVENIKRYFAVELDKFECNMRKYNIIGGVFRLELLKQPPQPKILKDGAILRMIIGKDEIQHWDYLETYEPLSVKPGTIKQSTDDDDEDAENTPEGKLLSKLVLVTMKLPEHVLWFDGPVPVHWDYENRYWSTQYIYEVKFNEEKQTLSFRAGKMTAFGLAVFKYNNFPYQSWELKFDDRGIEPQVMFGLTTSALVLEFLIRRNEISLMLLENANTTALQQHVGIFYPPRILVGILRHGGVNIFPTQDACLYVDSMPKKHAVTEDHLHHCMAVLCQCYEFSWSRWNLMAGYKRFVTQIREIKGAKSNELLLVTDERVTVTEGADVAPSFAECGSTEEFYPDLLTLAERSGGEESTQIMSKMDPIFVETVYYFLSETRVMSFS